MKIKRIPLVLLAALTIVLQNCKEEEPDFTGYTLEVRAEIETTVELYSSEQDFFSRENALAMGIVTGDTQFSTFFIHDFDQPDIFWVYAHRGNLNNIRGGNGCCESSGFPSGFSLSTTAGKYSTPTLPAVPEDVQFAGLHYTFGITPNLGLTPTRLQIQVLSQGLLIEGAEIQLYFSEEAYLNDSPAQQDLDELRESYFLGPQSTGVNKEIFNQITDREGFALFNDLEPKAYWFKITKGEANNETGTINLSEPLPDNADITTSITAGIN